VGCYSWHGAGKETKLEVRCARCGDRATVDAPFTFYRPRRTTRTQPQLSHPPNGNWLCISNTKGEELWVLLPESAPEAASNSAHSWGGWVVI
jgi:hypothetical protein